MAHKWYIVLTQSGKEFAARDALNKRIASDGYADISEAVVPTYKETVYKDGKKKQVVKKSFPGYIYIKMDLNKGSQEYCLETPYVTQFVTQGDNAPRPLSEKDVQSVLSKSETSADLGPVQMDFDVGQKALIIDGPFNNFQGTIKAIYPDKRKVCVNVEIFGRTTPVEIDYFKVKKF